MEDVFRTTDEASVALLRGLRAGTVDHSFVHRADVCSAVPEELVAGLQPVPGTEATDDGYHSVWYIYCPKRYKNSRGVARGHRQRAVETAEEMCWHSETGPKPVQGVPGATVCDLSYGRKEEQEEEEVPGRRRQRQRFERMGWKMKEFDDTQGGGGDHVLCRVHRASSSLAKTKFKKPSSSSSSSSSSKRKAAGDHPQAPPTKMIHDEQVQVQVQMQMQQDPAAFFTDAYQTQTLPCYGYGGPPGDVDLVTIVGGEEEERGVQQPRVAEHVDGGGEFSFNVEELLNMEEFTNANANLTTMPCYVHGGAQGVDDQAMSGVGEEEHGAAAGEEEHSVQQQQPRLESAAEHGGFDLEELLNTDDWKSFLQMLQADGEQGQQQPSAELEQRHGGGIVVSGDLLYAC